MDLRLTGGRAAGSPVAAVLVGAGLIAGSAVLVRASGASPSTAAFFRCLYALPVLGLLALRSRRAHGALPARSRLLCWGAGVLLAVDMIIWHHAIEAVGAGLATVLANLQVLIIALVAWWLLGERPGRSVLVAIPVMLGGVVLISGLLGGGTYGAHPALGVWFGLGASVSYAAYLLVLRQGMAGDARRAGDAVQPLFHATAGAAVSAGVIGLALGDLHWHATLREQGWLVMLALTSQVCGWLLITTSLPRLPAALTSVLLLAQPVGSVGLGALVFGEAPTPVQLGGVVLILAGVVVSTTGRPRPRPVTADPDPDPPEARHPVSAGGRPQPVG